MDGKGKEVLEQARRMYERDTYPNSLGIELLGADLGRARVRLRVAERHVNCNGVCHGGLIFSLADTAFGIASNAYGLVAAAIDVHIVYHVAGKLGDELTATATEVSRNKKLGVYRIAIAREGAAGEGEVLIASFTGTAYIAQRSNQG
jgi:phenylacetic acid degradation protein PaaD